MESSQDQQSFMSHCEKKWNWVQHPSTIAPNKGAKRVFLWMLLATCRMVATSSFCEWWILISSENVLNTSSTEDVPLLQCRCKSKESAVDVLLVWSCNVTMCSVSMSRLGKRTRSANIVWLRNTFVWRCMHFSSNECQKPVLEGKGFRWTFAWL